MFKGQCATIMALASLILTLSLFLLVTDSWIGGYALVLPFVGQLFINSLIGTIATIQVSTLNIVKTFNSNFLFNSSNLLVRQIEREYLEVSILFVASSGSKRFSVFHATRHGSLRHEVVLHRGFEFEFIH
jgi:hypothetical protein